MYTAFLEYANGKKYISIEHGILAEGQIDRLQVEFSNQLAEKSEKYRDLRYGFDRYILNTDRKICDLERQLKDERDATEKTDKERKDLLDGAEQQSSSLTTCGSQQPAHVGCGWT